MANRAGVLAFAALVAFCGGVAGAGEPDKSPPAGIVPTTATLAQIVAAYRSAAGAIRPGTQRTRDELWSLSLGSMTGTYHVVASGSDERSDETLGPSTKAHGTLGGREWQMNANGQVAFGTGMHQEFEIDARALHAPNHPDTTLLGQVDAPVSAYVVKVDPPHGSLEYLFFDRRTYLIDRVETVEEGRRVTIDYTDFRSTQGLVEPWHVHRSDSLGGNDEDRVVASLTIGQPVAPSMLAIPTSAPPLIAPPPAPTQVPAQIDADRIVVQTTMGGHKVDFLMDSGASDIVIDKNVVEALGIKQYGRYTGQTAGTYTASDVVIPKIVLGSLTLENVHATSLPFFRLTADERPIAGLLGYDFICNLVWHVDYLHGTLEAIAPQNFAPPAGAHAFDLTFDDFVPTIQATLGGVAAPAFIVDTGADRSVLFSSFADAHAQALSDRGLGDAMQAAFPFVNRFGGVGGTVDYQPLQSGPLVLGPWTFPKWLFYLTQNAASFEFEDYDGLIGQDMLRNFDLYLDYPHSKLYLLPNDRFRQRWST